MAPPRCAPDALVAAALEQARIASTSSPCAWRDKRLESQGRIIQELTVRLRRAQQQQRQQQKPPPQPQSP
eukprot:3412969-Alexandrium_andersonii.AAC.1